MTPCHDGTKSKQQVTLLHACSADGSGKLQGVSGK